jgi:hypothetical protein
MIKMGMFFTENDNAQIRPSGSHSHRFCNAFCLSYFDSMVSRKKPVRVSGHCFC